MRSFLTGLRYLDCDTGSRATAGAAAKTFRARRTANRFHSPLICIPKWGNFRRSIGSRLRWRQASTLSFASDC
jgi:hypothetical protein